MTDIKWQEPPPHGNAIKSRWAEVAEALRARPLEWALIDEDGSPNLASRIRNGQIAAFRPASNFQVRNVRKSANGHDTYVRFVGTAGA